VQAGKKDDLAIAEKRALDGVYNDGPALPLPALEDLQTGMTIEDKLKSKSDRLDLRFLRYIRKTPKAQDLQALTKPDAVNYVRSLNCDFVELHDDDIEPIGHLRLLESLNLDRNHLRTLHHLANLTELNYLNLSSNEINEQGMKTIGRFHKLQVLKLFRTPVSDADLPQLYGLSQLRYVGLRECPALTATGCGLLRKALPKCAIDYVPGAQSTPSQPAESAEPAQPEQPQPSQQAQEP
jgi:Leucine-rich repeat (LRR) protein